MLLFYQKNLFGNFRLDHFIKGGKDVGLKWPILKLSNKFLDRGMDLKALLRIAYSNTKLMRLGVHI